MKPETFEKRATEMLAWRDRLKARLKDPDPFERGMAEIGQRDLEPTAKLFAQIELIMKTSKREQYERSKARNPPPIRQGFVYVIECPPLLRVGFSANPQKRMRNLFTDIPDVEGIVNTLEVLAMIPGGFDDERKLHHSLDEWSCGGAWYVDCRELRDFLIARGFSLQPTKRRFKMPQISRRTIERREQTAKALNRIWR